MTGISILAADDDAEMRAYLARFLASCGHTSTCVTSGDEVLTRLRVEPLPNLILLDMMMPGTTGLEVLAYLKKSGSTVPVIVLSGVGDVKTVVEAVQLGAANYLLKPFEAEELQLTIQNTLQNTLEKLALRDEVKTLKLQLAGSEENEMSVSSNPKMIRVREIARQVADTDVPVLILGESGTGKEVMARSMHARSSRAGQPFVKVNCAALPHDLLESELFGYERGAFTGAVGDKRGKFEAAGHGTILLDEIGEMSTALQAKLLHVLQDSEYNRLGGERLVPVHARVLASTNRRLEQMVSRGEFREDLYFRLNVITIEMPPLREHPEDIPLLCAHFVAKYREKYRSAMQRLPRDLMEALVRFDWPGNIRQLENAIKRYLILPDAEIVPGQQRVPPYPEIPPVIAPVLFLKDVGAHAAEQAEREIVLKTLDQTRWNRKAAARLLNVSYKALRNKLKKWNLRSSIPGSVASQQSQCPM